jgi:hypothetical protein
LARAHHGAMFNVTEVNHMRSLLIGLCYMTAVFAVGAAYGFFILN